MALVCGACRIDFDPLPSGDGGPAVDAVALAPCDNSVGLVACYSFDGDANDRTANHNDATATGVSYGPGVSGSAIDVDASSLIHVVDSQSLDITDQITIEAWVRIAALPPSSRAVILDHNNGYAFWFDPTGLLVCGMFTGANYRATATAALGTNTWHHVACTYDELVVTAWIDGTMVASATGGGPLSIPADAVEIAGNAIDGVNPNPDRFVGSIDQLRIWHLLRTSAELCAAAGTC